MEWFTVIVLVLLGLGLIIIEIILVPGTTIVGVAGAGFLLAGIFMSYRYFGVETGSLVLTGTAAVSAIMFYRAFRSKAWRRFALKTVITGRVNEIEAGTLVAGMEGTAISALRPSGKGEFDNEFYEVRTQGQFVDSGTKIRIVTVSSNQILVEEII